jgi:hypothetical protein
MTIQRSITANVLQNNFTSNLQRKPRYLKCTALFTISAIRRSSWLRSLSFKNRRNQMIFEETAYPIYASSLSHAQGSKAVAPGQEVKFAFRSPACPKNWQPGQVDVHVTRVAASDS